MISRIGKRKRRGQTAPRMPMKLAAVSVLSLFSPSLMAANINIAQSPLAGVQSTYQPNIVLVPSVEYPTAGGAYASDEFMSDDLTPWVRGYLTLKYSRGDFNRRYLGYFDSDKCYEFKADGGNNGYFYATSRAQAPDYACPKANEFSGNVLNWGTMSALDMFRKTLTAPRQIQRRLGKPCWLGAGGYGRLPYPYAFPRAQWDSGSIETLSATFGGR